MSAAALVAGVAGLLLTPATGSAEGSRRTELRREPPRLEGRSPAEAGRLGDCPGHA